MLLSLEGHQIQTARDGEHALDIADSFEPEVVVLDIGMPRLGGHETVAALRQRAWSRDTLFVAVTGWGQPEDRRRSLAAGFDHHLVKPVDPGELLALLAKSAQSSES